MVHRQFVVSFVPPSLIVAESARLVQFRVTGLVTGLFLGSLMELAPFKFYRFGVRTVQISSWFMAFLWALKFVRLFFTFKLFSGNVPSAYQQSPQEATRYNVDQIANAGDSSDSSDDDPPPSIFQHSVSDRISRDASPVQKSDIDIIRKEAILGHVTGVKGRKRRFRRVKTLARRIRKILTYNIAVPVTLALAVYAAYSQEILFSSCALITDRYFEWKGYLAGIFLGSLSLMSLPIDFVCEQIARRYGERTIMKRSVMILGTGLMVMVNWGSIFALVKNLRNLLTETKNMRHHYYDWLLGIAQYVIGFSVTFLGMKALEGSSRSLLSKVSPPNSKSMAMNLGNIAIFVSLFAQLIADVQIITVGLSHRVINTDIVNALVVPMVVACLVAYYFLRKHFFFLI